jgi:hypothetical protein
MVSCGFMSDKQRDPSPARRGRKPIGSRAMTAAERKRASRERQVQNGMVEFSIRLRGGPLNFLDQFAQVHGSSRAYAVEVLLEMAIARVGNAVARAELLRERGGSDEQVAHLLHEALSDTPDAETADKYKEVLGIK